MHRTLKWAAGRGTNDRKDTANILLFSSIMTYMGIMSWMIINILCNIFYLEAEHKHVSGGKVFMSFGIMLHKHILEFLST
jgi:uncharacterized protein with PQ loop repeat